MAITRTALQTAISDTGSAVASLVLTLTGSVPQGATIVLGAYHSANNASAGTMVDSSGNTYTAASAGGPTALNAAGANGYLATWYADNALALVAGDTLTFTPPASAAKIALEVSYLQGNSVPAFIVAIAGTGSSTSPASGTPTVNATNAIPAGGISLTFVGFRNASSITETFTAGGTATAGQSVQGNASAVTAGIFEEYNSVNGSPPNGTGTLGHTDTWAAITLHFRPTVNWFYDYEGGSDFNGGDSFATLATGTDGVGNGTTTFTSASAAFDSTYLGRRINISKTGTGTQGLYLIVTVNSATSIVVNANVTTNTGYIWNVGGRFQTPKFGGNVGQNSPTTQNSGAGIQGTAMQPGDTARLMASPDPQDVGTTAQWTSNTNANSPTTACKSIVLTAAQNATIDTGDAAWTASANVTCTADGTFFVGGSNTHSAKQTIAAGFTTGLAAFKATGTLNLSSYQQVCFWVFSSVVIAAGQYSVRLCSDTAGVTTVNTVAIPPIANANQWTPVVVDTGGALGSSIQSVALYVDSDQGAVQLYLCGLFAAKAPGAAALTLHSLVGKNTVGEPYWWAVRTVEGASVYLDTGQPSTTNNQSSQRGYFGTSETVELWKREPIVFTVSSTSGNTFVTQQGGIDVGTNGTLVNAGPVYYSLVGGWDRTAMASQSAQTWVTFSNGAQNGFVTSGGSAAYLRLDGLGAVRALAGIGQNQSATQVAYGTVQAVACNTGIWLQGTSGSETATVYAIGCGTGVQGAAFANSYSVASIGACVVLSSASTNPGLTAGTANCLHDLLVGSLTACNNNASGAQFSGAQQVLVSGPLVLQYNGAYGLSAINGSTVQVQGAPSFAGNASGSVQATLGSVVDIQNASTSDSTAQSVDVSSLVRWTRFGGTATDHREYWGVGTVLSDTTMRHTASGISWSLSPTSARDCHAARPMRLKIASIACTANEARTVAAWLRRNAGGITAGLCIPGGQSAGMGTTDQTTYLTSINTWSQLSLAFTPTVDCVIDVYAQVYGGSTLSAWVDDVSVT